MNRSMRRKQDKGIKKGLSQEQYKELKSELIDRMVNEKLNKFNEIFGEVIYAAFRRHRISEERANKIVDEIWRESFSKWGQVNEGLS